MRKKIKMFVVVIIVLLIATLSAYAGTLTTSFSGRIDGRTGQSPINQAQWTDSVGTNTMLRQATGLTTMAEINGVILLLLFQMMQHITC